MPIIDGAVLTAADLGPLSIVTLTTEDLDTITTRGTYYQSTGAEATTARHYPVAGAAGWLEVYPDPTNARWFQRLTGHPGIGANAGQVWTRAGGTGIGWSAWRALG